MCLPFSHPRVGASSSARPNALLPMKKVLYTLCALALTLGAVSCKKDTPATPTEQTQSTALTAGYWEATSTESSGTLHERGRFTFKPDGTYTYHYLREDTSEEHKDNLIGEFNDEYFASGSYSVKGNQIKLETFKLDRYADRFVEYRKAHPEGLGGLAGLVLIFDEKAQSLTLSVELSPKDMVDEENVAVLSHKF